MVTTQHLTAHDFVQLASDEPWELWEGELRQMPGAGLEASEIAGIIFSFLFAFVRPRDLGVVSVTDGAYLLAHDPDVIVIPDVAFIAWDRLPGRVRPRSYAPAPPNLAVEVISPSDGPSLINDKMDRYRAAGVGLVWWVRPQDRSVAVYHRGHLAATLTERDTLSGLDILPGFTLPVREIFL